MAPAIDVAARSVAIFYSFVAFHLKDEMNSTLQIKTEYDAFAGHIPGPPIWHISEKAGCSARKNMNAAMTVMLMRMILNNIPFFIYLQSSGLMLWNAFFFARTILGPSLSLL